MDTLKYVELEDGTHIIGPGEYTACGIVIPYPGSPWSRDEPKKLCSKCKARAEDTDEFGASEVEAAPTPLAAPTATKEDKSSGSAKA